MSLELMPAINREVVAGLIVTVEDVKSIVVLLIHHVHVTVSKVKVVVMEPAIANGTPNVLEE